MSWIAFAIALHYGASIETAASVAFCGWGFSFLCSSYAEHRRFTQIEKRIGIKYGDGNA